MGKACRLPRFLSPSVTIVLNRKSPAPYIEKAYDYRTRHLSAPNQVVEGLLGRLLEQSRYLDHGEILELLTAFREQLSGEIDQIGHFSDRRGQLLAEIADAMTTPVLGNCTGN